MFKQRELFPKEKNNFTILAKHTTHSGGRGEYLHDWYAYLEGYSSEFVKSIYTSYMPNSKLILEPFAGVGTTPLSLAFYGVNSLYCEVNPVMRRIIAIKIKVAKLSTQEKKILSLSLKNLAENLCILVAAFKEDAELSHTYALAFKKSLFFSEDNYLNLLKIRALNDSIILKDPLIGEVLEIAVASKIIECSKLKRAGDLRFKTESELRNGIPNLIDRVKKHLIMMADDCEQCPPILAASQLLINNSKKLYTIGSVKADGLITSPPYLNGTNYFRNSKLELWYMRDIIDSTSLRKFRNDAITAGINDVIMNKNIKIHPSIKSIMKELDKNTYDVRIPKMVAGYFEEMSDFIKGASCHLILGARACIDIGDSTYAGVYIPTHKILSKIAEEYGFETIEIVKLRDRKSRDQSSLSQSLIVLEKIRNL